MFFPTRQRDPVLYPHRHGLYFSFFNALNWQVAIGTPTVLFMQQLGADSFQVGLVFAWTFLLTPVQVLATAFLPQLGFKRLALAGWSLRGWTLLVPIGLCLLAPHQPVPWMIYSMVTTMFLYGLTRAVGAASLTAWIYQLVPAEIRGRYWATDQMLSGLAIMGALLFYSALFVVLPIYWAFLAQYVVAIFGGWQAYRKLRILPDVERPKMLSLEKIVTETPRLMIEPSLFRTYLWLSVPLYFTITPISPFAAFYLKATAGLTAASIMMLTMLTYVGLIIANWFMRAHLDHHGAKPFFRLSYGFFALIAAGWMFFLQTHGRFLFMLPALYLLQGAASGCWTSANLNYLAKILPENDRALPVSIHGAVITFLGGFSPVLWGLFMKSPDPAVPVNVPVFEAFFLTLLLTSGMLYGMMQRLPEKTGPAYPLLQGGWLLRPFRGLGNLISLVERDDAEPPSDSA
ncbi:MAG: MFS transporter [Opitutaceae bacterium]